MCKRCGAESAEVADARELSDRIYHAIHLVPDDGTPLNAHCFAELRWLMGRLDPEYDMKPSEVMAINVVLATANARKSAATLPGPGVTRRPDVPPLRIVS